MCHLHYYFMLALLAINYGFTESQETTDIHFDQKDVAEYDLTPEEVEELERLSQDAVRSGAYQPSEWDNPAEDRLLPGTVARRLWHWIGFGKFHEWLKNKKNKQQSSAPSPVPIYIVNHISLGPGSPPMNFPGFPRPYPGKQNLQQRPPFPFFSSSQNVLNALSNPLNGNGFQQDVVYL